MLFTPSSVWIKFTYLSEQVLPFCSVVVGASVVIATVDSCIVVLASVVVLKVVRAVEGDDDFSVCVVITVLARSVVVEGLVSFLVEMILVGVVGMGGRFGGGGVILFLVVGGVQLGNRPKGGGTSLLRSSPLPRFTLETTCSSDSRLILSTDMYSSFSVTKSSELLIVSVETSFIYNNSQLLIISLTSESTTSQVIS